MNDKFDTGCIPASKEELIETDVRHVRKKLSEISDWDKALDACKIVG